MFATTQTAEVKTTQRKDYRCDYIFVLQLHDGRIVVGQANNAGKRICSINSGYNAAIPQPLQVNRIIGVKEQNETRTFAGVVAKLCERYGQDKVIAV